jgi:hypothetical protein
MALVEVLYRPFSGLPKKRHKKTSSGLQNFRPIFETTFSGIQVHSVTAILAYWVLLNVNCRTSHYTVFIFKFVSLWLSRYWDYTTGLEDRGFDSRHWKEIFSSPQSLDRIWSPSALYPMGTGGYIRRNKEEEA